jgi:hypothetical protein
MPVGEAVEAEVGEAVEVGEAEAAGEAAVEAEAVGEAGSSHPECTAGCLR